jgi:hypothetical protein
MCRYRAGWTVDKVQMFGQALWIKEPGAVQPLGNTFPGTCSAGCDWPHAISPSPPSGKDYSIFYIPFTLFVSVFLEFFTCWANFVLKEMSGEKSDIIS